MDRPVVAMTVLAAYDVADDGRRARVAATLQRWGDRIQYSVFICSVDVDDLAELRQRIVDIVDPERDSFFVVRQCANCWDQLDTIGQAHPPEAQLYWAAL